MTYWETPALPLHNTRGKSLIYHDSRHYVRGVLRTVAPGFHASRDTGTPLYTVHVLRPRTVSAGRGMRGTGSGREKGLSTPGPGPLSARPRAGPRGGNAGSMKPGYTMTMG